MSRKEIQFGYFLVAAFAVFLVWDIARPFFKPAPYRNVQVAVSEVVNGQFNFTATFEKTGCTFVRLNVIRVLFNQTDFLDWWDNDLLPHDYDREAGLQTLRISALLGGRDYDAIEIRTRHDCAGKIVDRVFATHKPEEIR